MRMMPSDVVIAHDDGDVHLFADVIHVVEHLHGLGMKPGHLTCIVRRGNSAEGQRRTDEQPRTGVIEDDRVVIAGGLFRSLDMRQPLASV